MIQQRKMLVAGAPAWILSAGEPALAGARGTVLFYHRDEVVNLRALSLRPDEGCIVTRKRG